MKIESRKLNLINWLSSAQEEDLLAQLAKTQNKKLNLHYSYLFGGMNLNAGNPDLVELVFGKPKT